MSDFLIVMTLVSAAALSGAGVALFYWGFRLGVRVGMAAARDPFEPEAPAITQTETE